MVSRRVSGCGSVCVCGGGARAAAAAAAAPCRASPPGGAAAATAFLSTSRCAGRQGLPSPTTTTEAGASPEPLWGNSASSDSVGSGDCGRRGRAAGGCCAWARGLGGAASPSKLCPGGAAPCFMFMFRSRKNALVKRAWKARRTGLGDAHEDVPQALKGAALQLLRRLTEAQLDLLVTALDSGGVEPGECVLVPRAPDSERVGGAALAPHLLMVRVWRWPDLHDAPGAHGNTPLRRLPCCAARNDHVYVCANPYHWARVLQTGRRLRGSTASLSQGSRGTGEGGRGARGQGGQRGRKLHVQSRAGQRDVRPCAPPPLARHR